jgi:hypothetical protein
MPGISRFPEKQYLAAIKLEVNSNLRTDFDSVKYARLEMMKRGIALYPPDKPNVIPSASMDEHQDPIVEPFAEPKPCSSGCEGADLPVLEEGQPSPPSVIIVMSTLATFFSGDT